MKASKKELLKPKCEEKELHTEEEYDNMLDECYDDFMGHSPSYTLQQVDPIMYNCGFSDFQEYEDVYICPICGEEYDDYDEALYCCQADQYVCGKCGEEYDEEEEAEDCCY